MQRTEYFKILLMLEEIKFRKSIVPADYDAGSQPVLITFNDGNLDRFGVVAYALRSLTDGSKSASIILAKVNLALMLQIGDSYRNELGSEVFAARLKS